jgi:hypothetical protein
MSNAHEVLAAGTLVAVIIPYFQLWEQLELTLENQLTYATNQK